MTEKFVEAFREPLFSSFETAAARSPSLTHFSISLILLSCIFSFFFSIFYNKQFQTLLLQAFNINVKHLQQRLRKDFIYGHAIE